jgi:hypothetical protein
VANINATATFVGVVGLIARYTPPPNWWIDSHVAWLGTVGASAPPYPVPDEQELKGPYGQNEGISASPPAPFMGSPPPIDPAVAALNQRLTKYWGVT